MAYDAAQLGALSESPLDDLFRGGLADIASSTPGCGRADGMRLIHAGPHC